MTSKNRMPLLQISQFVAIGLLLALPASAEAQIVVATVGAGSSAGAVAVNPVTDKIYVATCGTISGIGPGSLHGGPVAVIDGQTNAFITIGGEGCASALAVNPATNKIYFINGENVSVIDGATDAASMTTVADSNGPETLAVNPVTNKIYVANKSGNVSVIDGATNSITTISDPNANGLSAVAIAVNPVTNKIYVANNGLPVPVNTNPGNITVLDGATNSTTTVMDPNAFTPFDIAVNTVTNKIYVANEGDYPGSNHGNITVLDGATNSVTTLTDSNALAPVGIALNQTTNKIYVADANDSAVTGNGGLTVIDGATNSLSFVSAGSNSHIVHAVALDSVTNTIYVTSEGCFLDDPCRNPGSVTIINGSTNAVTTIINPSARNPEGLAVNEMSNKIYVANTGSNNVTVIDGGATPTSHVLWALLTGNESGTVTSNPPGVNCGTSCIASFATGAAVNLTASPAPGSTFSGWSSACNGAGPCNLTLNSDDFVTATFGSPGDFSIQPASVNLTAQRGGQVTDAITIAPLNVSFTTAVQLSCSVTPSPANSSPALATCSLSSTSVTPGANPVTSTLTITAPSQSARLTLPSKGQLSSPLYAVILPIPLALIGLGLAGSSSKNRTRGLWLLCSLCVAILVLQAGCGGGSSNQTITSPPLSYTVTVTAISGTIQHTNLVNVTVQ